MDSDRESPCPSEPDIFSKIGQSPEGEIKNARSFHLTKSIIIQQSNSFESIIIHPNNFPNIKKIDLSALQKSVKNEGQIKKQQLKLGQMNKRCTPVTNNNFYVPSLQHPSNRNCFHASSMARLYKSEQYQFWYYLAIALFIIFIICGVLPGKQLVEMLKKIQGVMDGVVSLIWRVIQFSWQNLL